MIATLSWARARKSAGGYMCSMAAQIGRVLEPVGGAPVVIENDIFSFYSYRRATSGSTFVALRAGT